MGYLYVLSIYGYSANTILETEETNTAFHQVLQFNLSDRCIRVASPKPLYYIVARLQS